MLFTVADAHLNAELLVDMLSQVLGTIDTTVLTTRAAKTEHQTGKATLDIAANMGIGQTVDTLQEGQYLSIIFKEANDRLVETC